MKSKAIAFQTIPVNLMTHKNLMDGAAGTTNYHDHERTLTYDLHCVCVEHAAGYGDSAPVHTPSWVEATAGTYWSCGLMRNCCSNSPINEQV